MPKQSESEVLKAPYGASMSLALVLILGIALGLRYFAGFPGLLSLVLAVNLSAFGIMASDKSRAAAEKSRVPESALLTLALIGGSPGVMLAMKMFRHKTKKGSFKSLLGIIVIGQILILGAVFGKY